MTDDDIYFYIDFFCSIVHIPMVIFGLVNNNNLIQITIVIKGSKILDFVTTIVLLHFICCITYDGLILLNWRWTIFNGIWLFITTLAGEYFCLK